MNDDPIVAEVRKAREEYARRFNYDLDAICKDLQRKQSQSGRKLVAFPPKRTTSGAPSLGPIAVEVIPTDSSKSGE